MVLVQHDLENGSRPGDPVQITEMVPDPVKCFERIGQSVGVPSVAYGFERVGDVLVLEVADSHCSLELFFDDIDPPFG